MSFINYIMDNHIQILTLLAEHIKLTTIAVGFAIFIGVPLGIIVSYVKKLNKPILGIASVVQAIPSMALLGFMIPLLGIGTVPAVVTVILYALLPIIKNTCTGIDSINPQTLEAARGIGLTKFQILKKVQIPLALPIIMAGIRISAVTAVGLMTMAAFIGAGGLGYLVFSGIRTVNNAQILAGAIPACLLALTVDFLTALVERLVTPISLQKGEHHKKRNQRTTQKIILAVSVFIVTFAFLFTWFNRRIDNNKVITIGTKDFTEQHILGNLVADLIEFNTDISVERKMNLGGTQVCFSALTKDEIDMYIEYSGTAYSDTLDYPPISDMEKVYATVKKDFKEKYNIETLKQMSFNNTYVLAVRKDTAKKHDLSTLSDFAKIANRIKCGTTFEFLNREDGLLGLQKKYNFKMGNSVGLDGAARYIALNKGEVDVVDAFATDGLVKKFGLVPLVDDKSFFPPYYAMPIIREETLKTYPEILPLLEELGKTLTNEVMMELNYKVDELQMHPEDVARSFLIDNGFIKK